MSSMLNLTLPLKQDPDSKEKLKEIAKDFASKYWPVIEKALAKSGIVHHARFVVIEDKYIQILTEYDGKFEVYTKFFAEELADIFRVLFKLVHGVPDNADPTKADELFGYIKSADISSLGGGEFHAYGNKTIADVKADIELAASVRKLVNG